MASLPCWHWGKWDYRVKPEPEEPTKTPLTASDITPTTWVMDKNGKKYLVVGFNETEVNIVSEVCSSSDNNYDHLSYANMMKYNWKYSTLPERFYWKPCHKEEQSLSALYRNGTVLLTHIPLKTP